MHWFVHSCQEEAGTSPRHCSPFGQPASCECNHFCYKGLLSSPVAGKGNHSLKFVSELEKPCYDPGTISYCFNRDSFLGKWSQHHSQLLLYRFFDLPSFLPLQPKQPFSSLA